MLFARNRNNMCNILYRTFYPIVAKVNSTTSTTLSPGSTTLSTMSSTTTTKNTQTTSSTTVTTTTTLATTPSSRPMLSPILYSYGSLAKDTLFYLNDDDTPYFWSFKSIPFFYKNYSYFYISPNGFVSFLYSTQYFPDKLPYYKPTIAAYLSDVDLTVGGKIYYRESSNTSDLNKAQNDIFPVSLTSFYPTRCLIITWDQVAAHGGNPNVNNTFQLVIATNGTTTYGIFNFANMNWPQTNISKYNLFGYDFGDYLNYFKHPDSFISNLVSSSNMGTPGKWVFKLSFNDSAFNGLFNATLYETSTSSLATLPNGNLAVGSGYDQSTRYNSYDVAIHNITASSNPFSRIRSFGIKNMSEENWIVKKVVALPSGQVVSCSNRTIRVWNPDSGNLTRSFIVNDTISTMIALNDGNIAVSFFNSIPVIYNPIDGTLVRSLGQERFNGFSFANLDDDTLASGDFERVRIFNTTTGDLIRSWIPYSNGNGIYSLAVLPDGSLVTGGCDYSLKANIKIWNANNGSLIRNIYDLTSRTTLALAVLPDGTLVSSYSGFNKNIQVDLFNPASGALLRTVYFSGGYVSDFAVLKDGRLAVGIYSGVLSLLK